MPMPMNLAMRREKHGGVRKGNDPRQIWGDTSGEGSEDQAHVARFWMYWLFFIPSMVRQGSVMRGEGVWGLCGGREVKCSCDGQWREVSRQIENATIEVKLVYFIEDTFDSH